MDAPYVPLFMGGGAALALVIAIGSAFAGVAGLAVAAGYFACFMLVSVADYLYASLFGKFAVWADLLRSLELRGDERLLDLGCGRGAVILTAAKLLPRGRAVGNPNRATVLPDIETMKVPGVVNQLMGVVIRWQSGRAIDKTFGRRRYALASQAITRITSRKDPSRTILELPIATLPVARLPVHTTFVFLLGMGYFRLAAALLARFRRDSVFLFHAIDALDYPADGDLSRKVPALRYSLEQRRRMLGEMLRTLRTAGFTATSTRLVAEAPWRWPDSRLWG